MEHLAPGAKAADYTGNTKLACPRCRGNLIRRPRRPIDRLRSVFTPVQRYRCDRFSCRWTGNIRIDPVETHSLADPFRHPFRKNHMFTLLNILLVAALLLLVLLTAISASMSPPPTADIDLNETLPARDKEWTDAPTDGSPLAPVGNPSPWATPTMSAASAPE